MYKFLKGLIKKKEEKDEFLIVELCPWTDCPCGSWHIVIPMFNFKLFI